MTEDGARGGACAQDAVLLMIVPEADCFGGSNARRKSADSSPFPTLIRRIAPSSTAAAVDDVEGGETQNKPTTVVRKCCERAAPLDARQQAAGFDCLVVNAVDGTEADERQEGAVYGSSRRSFASQDYEGTSGTAPPTNNRCGRLPAAQRLSRQKTVCVLVDPHQRSLRSGPRPPQLSSSCLAFPFEQFSGCKPKLHRRVCFHHIV